MDAEFTSGLERRLRRAVASNKPEGIVRKPISGGVAHFAAGLSIEDYFENLGNFRLNILHRPDFSDIFRILRVMRDVWQLSAFADGGRLLRFKQKLWEFDAQLENAPSEHWTELAATKGIDLIEQAATSCRNSKQFPEIKLAYSMAIADRILHDRQTSAFLVTLLVRLAPTDKSQQPQKFVRRMRLPKHVERIVIARDRGKCSYCDVNITIELLARPHIDHIVPLSKGGCNDIVNLQLCCESCNLQKGNRELDLKSSVPRYNGGSYAVSLAPDI